MTDDELQKLCDKLSRPGGTANTAIKLSDCRKAAAELERLAHIVKEARKLLGENFEREAKG